MVVYSLGLEFIACASHSAQAMEILQQHARRERSNRRANIPAVHRAELRFSVRQFDRHGIVGKLRRHHVMMHVHAPGLGFRLTHCVCPIFICRRRFTPGVRPNLIDRRRCCQHNPAPRTCQLPSGGIMQRMLRRAHASAGSAERKFLCSFKSNLRSFLDKLRTGSEPVEGLQEHFSTTC